MPRRRVDVLGFITVENVATFEIQQTGLLEQFLNGGRRLEESHRSDGLGGRSQFLGCDDHTMWFLKE
jgi:hypothetical protein